MNDNSAAVDPQEINLDVQMADEEPQEALNQRKPELKIRPCRSEEDMMLCINLYNRKDVVGDDISLDCFERWN